MKALHSIDPWSGEALITVTIPETKPGLITRLVERWRQERRYRASLAALRGLDRRTLGDIGLNPGGLEGVAREIAAQGRLEA